MEEIEVWEHVSFILDPITWSDNDFKMMKNTLQNCLLLIRFFVYLLKISFKRFHSYKKAFEILTFLKILFGS